MAHRYPFSASACSKCLSVTNSSWLEKVFYFLIFITETVQELKSSSDIYNKFGNSFMARKGLYLLIFITETVQELKSSFNSCTI